MTIISAFMIRRHLPKIKLNDRELLKKWEEFKNDERTNLLCGPLSCKKFEQWLINNQKTRELVDKDD